MTFDEQRLRAIVAIADSGSLGRAADQVNMSQPALSRMIHDMELRLGRQLFERHSKGMTPTIAGDILLRFARQLTFDMQQAREALVELDGLRGSRVRVGAIASAIYATVAEAISALLIAAPQVSVEVFEAADGELTEALAERRIDLMIGSEGLVYEGIRPLGPCGEGDHFTVCCNRATARLLPEKPQLADVLQQRWVMLNKGRTPRHYFDGLIAQAGAAMPEIAIETNSIAAQIALLQTTGLLGWLPWPVVRDQIAADSLVALDIPALTLPRHFCIYRRSNGYLSRAAELFLEKLGVSGASPFQEA